VSEGEGVIPRARDHHPPFNPPRDHDLHARCNTHLDLDHDHDLDPIRDTEASQRL
jgi:hypothetical protein